MQEHRLLSFEPFRLDVRNAQLWRGQEVIRLTNKALAVLHYLAERSGQLVTKDDLFAAVWPGVVVSDSALVACIGELRRALVRQAKLGASCGVKVPAEQGLTNHSYRVLQLWRKRRCRAERNS